MIINPCTLTPLATVFYSITYSVRQYVFVLFLLLFSSLLLGADCNLGRENNGPSNLQDVDLQDGKIEDEITKLICVISLVSMHFQCNLIHTHDG